MAATSSELRSLVFVLYSAGKSYGNIKIRIVLRVYQKYTHDQSQRQLSRTRNLDPQCVVPII
jgi:hypothetical protein